MKHPATKILSLLLTMLITLSLLAACGGSDPTAVPPVAGNTPRTAAQPTAVATTSSKVTILSAVTSRGYESEEAVDPTSNFLPADRTLHCVVKLSPNPPSTTKVRAVWTAVDADGQQNTKIVEREIGTERNERVIHFTAQLARDWPTGKYKVEIYINEALGKVVDFTISSAPTAVANTSVTIDTAVTARSYVNGQAVDVTDIFGPTDRTIYAVIKFEKRPPITTKVRATWTAINADGSSDQFLDTDFVTSKGEDIVNFSAALDKDWPVGKYKVDIYVNGTLVKTIDYKVA